jgi:hypothetical protein
MEHVMNGPGWWESELVCHSRDPFRDRKGAVTFWGQFACLIGEIKVGAF